MTATSTTITDGPMAGWDLTITHIEHGIDAMDDRYYLDLYQPGADHPAHTFHTFRYGYGWNNLNAALTGKDEPMAAALQWWTANQSTPLYAVHRILLSIDHTTWATATEIAQRLAIPADALNPDQPYGQALATAERT